MSEQQVDGAAVVLIVDPRDVLGPKTLRAAETGADEAGEDGEDAAPVGAHDHGGAQGDLAGARCFGGTEGLLPTGGDVDGEGPGFGEVGGFACSALGGQVAEFAGELVLRPIEGVAVVGGGGGVE